MITDNRTNEPTDEQVEAAARAIREVPSFDEGVSSELLKPWSVELARAALEAATRERDAALAVVERVAVEIEAVAGGITSSSEASGYRNGLLRAAQIVRATLDGKERANN